MITRADNMRLHRCRLQVAFQPPMCREQVIDNSVRATRAFVKQYLSDTITRAQSSIASYGAQYSERMFAALTTCQQGKLPPSLSEPDVICLS